MDTRPLKKRRTENLELEPLPPAILLLSLQYLLSHPPTHQNHTRSLNLTLTALRKCLELPGLDYITEFRAWTELAETGFRLGLDQPEIEAEVEKSITKALLILNKYPSLRLHKPRLTILSAKLASYRNNTKFAQNKLKDLIVKFLVPSDPPHLIYFSHLAYINSLSSNPHSRDSSNSSPKVLNAISDLRQVAQSKEHSDIISLSMVLELLQLLQGGIWTRLYDILKMTEDQLDISQTLDCNPSAVKNTPLHLGSTSLQTVSMIYTLIIGVIFFTYAGDSTNAQHRMRKLHEMLDGGAIDVFGDSGIVKVDFPDSPSSSLEVQVTHPRLLLSLGFLVSSIAKRDPVGGKPKRRLFACEGVQVVERELRKEPCLPIWTSISDAQEFQQRLYKIKADMICELIGVAITRSEFDEAEREISRVISLTRLHGLFPTYSSRITLHQAHLAHALGNTERALKCYQVAAFLSRVKMHSPSKRSYVVFEDEEGCEDHWVNVSARVGELWLRVGLASMIEDETEWISEMEVLRTASVNVVKECEGLGGTLQAVGAVLTACLSKEFLVAKTQLQNALNLSTSALDNHLRGVVLALVAAQYFHTSPEYAETILNAAEQLAVGLGPLTKSTNIPVQGKRLSPKSNDGVPGNPYLRAWIGERSLELKRRAGDEKRVMKQAEVNKRLECNTNSLRKRKISQIL